MDFGDSSNEVHIVQETDLDILCVVTVANLGVHRILDLITERDDPETLAELSISEQAIDIMSAAAAVGYMSLIEDRLKEGFNVDFSGGLVGSPLLAAAVGGHEAAVRLLVEAGAKFEAKVTHESRPVLYIAAEYGRDAAVGVLLEKGANLTFDPNERQALHYAMKQGGHERVILELLRHGAQINAKTAKGETALHYAASIGVRTAVLDLLIDQGADIEAKNNLGQTPLFVALTSQRKATFVALLSHGANIQARVHASKPMLHQLIIDKARPSLMHILIQHGFAIDAGDDAGETALHWAVAGRETVATLLLLLCGADINCAAENGATPLHRSVDLFDDCDAMPRLLLARGARVDARTAEGRTALQDAAKRGHAGVARVLLDGGADVNAVDGMGRTALHEAAKRGHEAVVRLLLERGADVNAVDGRGDTVLHLNARMGMPALVGIVLERGIAVDVRNKAGETALHAAGGGTVRY